MKTFLATVTKTYSQSSEQWLEKIRDGDQAAFELLFRTFYSNLHWFLIGYVNDRHIAEDLVQEMFVRVWENRQTLDPSKMIKPYLYQIARNLAIDHTRHKKVVHKWEKEKKALYQFSFVPKGLDEKVHDKMILKKIEHAIEDLPERRRLIFILSRYNSMTYKEIADALEISVNTVETQI